MTIGERLMALRADLGYSQRAIAELLGVSVGCVCRWERGQRTPPKSAMMVLEARFPEWAGREGVALPACRGQGAILDP